MKNETPNSQSKSVTKSKGNSSPNPKIRKDKSRFVPQFPISALGRLCLLFHRSMALQCFTWTVELLGSLFCAICKDDDFVETFERLPDFVIIDILSRLPPNSLLSCRRVCKDWKALISSPYFTTSHLDRHMYLIQDRHSYMKRHGLWGLYVFGSENLDRKKVYSKVHLRPELMINKHIQDLPFLLHSCHGVLLFIDLGWESTYYVLNPITQEEVTVQHALHPGHLCALYFCPLTRQFKLLYAQIRGSCCQYLVYMFKTQTWRKIRSSSFNFLPCCSPAVVNGALHWITFRNLERKGTPPCANGIMIYKIDKEELCTMPHPGSVCNSQRVHGTMTLLVKDDHLALCHVLGVHYAVDIWILEDYEMWRWNKRYKIKLFNTTIFPFILPCSTRANTQLMELCKWIQLLSIQDGELVFYLEEVGFVLHNLDDKTTKKVEGPVGEKVPWRYSCKSYTKSLLAIA